MADKTNRVVLQYIIDKAALANVKTELTNVRAFMLQQAAAAKQVDLATAQAGKSIREAFSSTTSSRIESIVKSTDRLKKSFDEAKASAIAAKNNALDALNPDEISTGAGGGRLKSFGRELKALPAVQIPGLGISTDAIGKISQLLGSLPPVALKTSGALLGVSTALLVLQQNAAKVKEAATEELNARQRALELLQAGNKQEVQDRIKTLEAQREKNRLALADAQAFYNKFSDEIEKSFGRVGLIVAEFNSEVGTGATELKSAKEDIEAAQKAFNETDTELLLLKNGVADLGDTAATAAQQVAQANSLIAQNQSRISAQIEAANLAATGTEKQVQDRLDALAREKDVLQANLPILEAERKQYEEGSEAQKALQGQIDSTRQRLSELDTTMLTLAGDTLQTAKANDARIASEKYLAQQTADTATAVKKYNDDVARLNQQDADSRAKLREAISDILENAQKQAEEALAKLEQRRAEIVRDFVRDGQKDEREARLKQIDIQIDAQRQEIDIYKAYRRRLRDIQRDADAQSVELALNRDFAGLFELGRTTQQQRAQAAQDEQDAVEDAIESRNRNLEDLARATEAERQERLIALQQQLTDVQDAYVRERVQIDAQRKDAEARARAQRQREADALREQLNTRQQAIRSELQLIQQGEKTRLEITQQATNALIVQARRLLTAVSAAANTGGGIGGGGKGRAFGGSVAAGQAVKVNELAGQRERFNGQLLPAGQGLFIPFTSGNVSANGGGGGVNVSITQHIQGGGDESMMAKISAREIERVLVRIFKPARGTA